MIDSAILWIAGGLFTGWLIAAVSSYFSMRNEITKIERKGRG
jgi:hypothetical protein